MLSLIFNTLLEVFRSTYVVNLASGLTAIWAVRMAYLMGRKRPKTTRLKGPSTGLFGAEEVLFESVDAAAVYEAWYKEHGVVYEIPMILGERKIILCDPKAIAHLFSMDSWTYVLAHADKVTIARSVREFPMSCIFLPSRSTQIGKGVLWADGETHRMSVSVCSMLT